MSPDKGPVIVFVEELGEKWVRKISIIIGEDYKYETLHFVALFIPLLLPLF
jgi:hypothetical protein